MNDGVAPTAVFTLPEYSVAARAFFWHALRELAVRKEPFLTRIMGPPIETPLATINTTPTGETVRSEPMTIEVGGNFSRQAGIEGDFDDLYDSLDHVAAAYAKSLMGQFFGQMTTVLDAYGNVVDATGKDPATTLLEMFERVEWIADENGVVHPPELHVGTEAAKVIEGLPPSFSEALEDIAERKQAAYDARKRSRRLPRNR